ncbi:MAG: fused MFS/spermidine synthase [Vicinamibacterales bacterium]
MTEQAGAGNGMGPGTVLLPVALAVFFTSGFAALLYQVIWQRMLAIFSGADVYSASVIVAAFMGGLGVGHIVGGHVADRVSRRTSLALFCGAEAAIAAFGFFSAALYYGFLYQRLGHLHIAREVVAVILFSSLLWPTFFMGASLPLLARAVTDRIGRAASTVGALYGFNTLGAALGATVATWSLLPQFGLEGSLRVGAMLNVACAASLLPITFWLKGSAADTPFPTAGAGSDRAHPAETDAERLAFRFWVSIYGFAGLVALSLEIVWFRLLGVMMKSTAFTFGTLLAVYLAGIGLGAVAGSALAPRVRRPGAAFLGLQAAGGLTAAILVTLFAGLADDLSALRGYFGSYEPLSVRESVDALRAITAGRLPLASQPVELPATFLRLYIAVPLLLIVPSTFLMGCSFPLLQRVVQTDLGRVGRRVGGLLLANIVGSIMGTVLTGWISLTVLGTAGTLRLLVVLSSVFALLGMAAVFRTSHNTARRRFGPTVTAGATGIVLLLVVRWMPDDALLWARLHGTSVDRIIFAEDISGVSVIKMAQEGFDGERAVFVNGVGQSVIPYGDIHTVLGALPAFVHPDPRDAAIIGLGSGDTVHAAAGRPGLERITSIEIVGPQLETLRALARRDPYGGLRTLLRDPRIEHVVGDGRTYLMRSRRRFDIIEADALRPTSAYSGNLYSDAYFRLVRERLKPNGLAATWTASERVHNAFVKVFPYVVSVPGVMLGSKEPIVLDRATIARRLADPLVRSYYERAGIDIERLIGAYLDGDRAHYGLDFKRDTLTDFNTDLFPKDEYDLSPPRR